MNPDIQPSQIPAASRRGFLKGAAAATAAVNLPIELCAQVAGSDQKKLALVGCGGRGSGAANQNLSSKDGSVKLVALADAFSNRLEGALGQLKSRFPDKVDVAANRKFVGLDAYEHAIHEADIVILATPPGFRPYHFKAAIDAGKHVFSEKPTCVDAVGAKIYHEAAKVADQKNLKVVVGLQRHYQNVYLATLEKVREGLIGQILSGQVYWNNPGVWVNERKPGQTEMEYQIYNWYYFTWLCGDHIVEQHVHNIDVFQWFLSEQLGCKNEEPVHPVSAQGMGGRQVRTDKKFGQIFDHHYVEFTYPNGVVLNSQCRHQPDTWNQVSETIVGEKGICYPGSGVIKDRTGKLLWSYKGEDDPDPYQVEHDTLHRAIKANTPLNNAYYGNTSSFVATFGRMATYGGKQIKWDDAWKSTLTDYPDKLAWDAQPKVLPDKDLHYPIAVPGKTKVL
ncbi:MAG: Gfo/Idh/MocA family oxidoreductase [Verrucomicrobiales bacterium]|nr:Gfo/Idh/MocA family oxidoreductase [Verrucomicrobiales bacterium]